MDQDKITQRQDESTAEAPPPFLFGQINPSMTTKDAYFQMLRAWVHQANMSQNALVCFPYYLMANYPQMFQTQQGTPGAATGPGSNLNQMNFNGNPAANLAGNVPRDRRIADYFDNLRQEEIINQNGGYEFVIAPLWKRFVAELIDVLILLLVKLMLTFTIVDLFDIKIAIDFDLDALKKSIETDYTGIFNYSSEFLLIEVITKICVCFYEALWTMNGYAATPGKMLMGIRIVHVDAVLPLQPIQPAINMNNSGTPLRALLFPASHPGFRRAFFRAVAKNVLMAILFPMCFVVMFFKNNRTGYDVMTKTIVVEDNQAPILRRR